MPCTRPLPCSGTTETYPASHPPRPSGHCPHGTLYPEGSLGFGGRPPSDHLLALGPWHPGLLSVTCQQSQHLLHRRTCGRIPLPGQEQQGAWHRGGAQERSFPRELRSTPPRPAPPAPHRHLTVAGGRAGTTPLGALDPPFLRSSLPAGQPSLDGPQPATASARELTLRVAPLHAPRPFRRKASLHPGAPGFSANPPEMTPGPQGPCRKSCVRRGRGERHGGQVHKPVGNPMPAARPQRAPRGGGPAAQGGAPGPGAAREGPAGWPGAAAGTRAGQGPAARRSSPRPRPDRGCRRRVRAAGAGWEPRSPRPRPRDGHALWPLRDSPPQRPRLSQAHRGQLPRA